MPKVTFVHINPKIRELLGGERTIEVQEGESILDAALENDIPLEHNCGGNCACTTCHVIVKEGMDNLSPMEDDEADRLDMAEGLTLNSRLGCQAKVYGDVIVEVPE